MTKATPKQTAKQKTSVQVWQDDSAAIPRERNLMIAWWIALVTAIVFILGAMLLKPDPYWEIMRFVGDGLVVTFEITIISMTLSLILGLIAGLGRTARAPGINILASLYVEVIRGIPLLAQLFWIYYAMSRFIQLGPHVSAVLGLTICYGAYIGETFRAGIQSIPKGQMEAARSLGLNRAQAMQHVIIPQAVRVILPPVGNEFIAMLKDSSLVSVLAISDMLRRGREYASRTFAYFEAYTLVALVYLLVTLIFSRVVFYIEQGMSRENQGQIGSLMHRLAGGIVDLVIVDVVGLIVYGLAQAVVLLLPDAKVWLMVALPIGLFTLTYSLFFISRSGRTPGMMAVGLRAFDSEGRPPSLGQAIKRLLLMLLPVPGLSLLWMLWSPARQPLYDQASQTVVIQD